jgi:predicted nucleic acid-binding Zn ribbon protein
MARVYEYGCGTCGATTELPEHYTDTELAAGELPCEACSAPMRRIHCSVPVHLKGGGWYSKGG